MDIDDYYYKPSYPEGMACVDGCRGFFNGRCVMCGAAASDYWMKRSMQMEQKLIDEVNKLRAQLNNK